MARMLIILAILIGVLAIFAGGWGLWQLVVAYLSHISGTGAIITTGFLATAVAIWAVLSVAGK
jgi:hypothetical protein